MEFDHRILRESRVQEFAKLLIQSLAANPAHVDTPDAKLVDYAFALAEKFDDRSQQRYEQVRATK